MLLSTAQVGKTSLIMSLVGEEFPEEVSVTDLWLKKNKKKTFCCIESWGTDQLHLFRRDFTCDL